MCGLKIVGTRKIDQKFPPPLEYQGFFSVASLDITRSWLDCGVAGSMNLA